jgi:hypothetical protein
MNVTNLKLQTKILTCLSLAELLLIALAVFLSPGRLAAEQQNTEAKQILERLNRQVDFQGLRSISIAGGERDLREAVKRDPESSIGVLVETVTDPTIKNHVRGIALSTLQDKEVFHHVSSSSLSALIRSLPRAGAKDYLTFAIAKVAAKDVGRLTESDRNELKAFALNHLDDPKYGDTLPVGLLNQFPNDHDVRSALIARLKTTKDKNVTVQALGHIKAHEAIPDLEQMLNEPSPKGVYKTRIILAIGEIGGDKAFKILRSQFDREKDRLEKPMIIMAIGLTKTSSAKQFLIPLLEDKKKKFLSSTLNAFKFLGDPKTIPLLEARRNDATLDFSEKAAIDSAIRAIKVGNDRPWW